MKITKLLICFGVLYLLFISCQKELYFDSNSDGALVCPVDLVNGSYMKDSVLDASNTVDVRINVTRAGKFEIHSDTLNGYHFNAEGDAVKGINIVHLKATGKPVAAGINHFVIRYGNSSCILDVIVTEIGPASFTLSGAPNDCTGAIAGGTYTSGTALTSSNTLTVQVNVTATGIYNISADSHNGFQFGASGIFTHTGIQTVTLIGTGIPVTAGISTVVATNVVSDCSFNITVQPPFFGTAVFTFDGAPNSCINFNIHGLYAVGAPLTPANTAVLAVNVTTPGSYILHTNSASGITFNASGNFVTAGTQTVTLTASGTPTTEGVWGFIPNTGITTSCSFALTVDPALPPAVLTLGGSPGGCTGNTVYGSYTANVALNPSNTAVIQVDVISAGTYTISTTTVNGISFSATGIFTVTGIQNVTLRGSGTPSSAGTITLTPHYTTSTCSFNVTVH